MKRTTKLEDFCKKQVIDELRKKGYATYARIFSLFDLILTEDPNTIGYMVPDKAIICLNKHLNLNQVNIIVRHEILHEYLAHMKRLQKFCKDKGIPYNHKIANYAADFEISNKGYTDADKREVRRIQLELKDAAKTVSGLVTEDHNPAWANLTVEELYEKLLEETPSLNIQLATAGEESEDQQNNGQGSYLDYPEDSAIQEAEEIARKAQIIKETEAENAKKDENKETAGQAKDISKEAEEIEKDIKNTISKYDKQKHEQHDNNYTKQKNIKVDDRENVDGVDADLLERIKEIKKAFADLRIKDQILDETREQVFKEKQRKADYVTKRAQADPKYRFIQSFDKFIKDEIGRQNIRSYRKFDKKKVGTGLIGKGKVHTGHIPSLAVFFDHSSSWGPADIKVGLQAIEGLMSYVKAGKLKIVIYYFADEVSTDPNLTGGNSATQEILDKIKEIHADNVLLMTDGDLQQPGRFTNPVIVPGACFILFRNYRSPILLEYLHGAKLNKVFDI